MLRTALLVFVLGAPLAQAQTYKWVDANGVVNYSNTPPPGGAVASHMQTVPDRISSYSPDQALTQPVEVYRRLDATQAEWLQRQQIMAMQQQQQAQMAAGAPETAYYPAYGTYYATRRPILRATHFVQKPVRPAQRASVKVSRL